MGLMEFTPPPAGLNPVWWPVSPQQQTAMHSKAQILMYGGASGGGKMLPLNMRIATPTGWTTMGELQPGDAIFDERGEPCRVAAIHPVDLSPVSYRLTFDDGVQMDACADHLWLTYDRREMGQITRLSDEYRQRRRAKRARRIGGKKSELFTSSIALRNATRSYEYMSRPSGSVRTTQTIAQTLLASNGERNHAIPVAEPLALPEANLPIDPYVLGAWLGDGNSRHASITCHDPEILYEIEKAGYVISPRSEFGAFGINKGLLGKLRDLNLLANKHIPSAYLRGSIAQRLSLLQGLMDTDGHACASGAGEFTTTSTALRDGFRELLATLGIKGLGTEGRAKIDGRDCGPKWRFKFTTSLPAFRMPRKLEKQNRTPRRTTRFRYVVSCDRIDPVPMRCITVDSPSHLYLAGPSMVPTHNTDFLVADAMQEYENPNLRAVLIRRSFKEMNQIMDRCAAIYRPFGAFWRSSTDSWIFPSGAKVRLGYMANDSSITKYQGNPFSWLGIDESTLLPETQVRNILPWLASPDASLFPRVRLATNPGNIGAGWHMRVFLRDKCPIHYPRESVQSGNVYSGSRWLQDNEPVRKTVSFVHAGAENNPLYGQDKLDSLESQTVERRQQLKKGCWCALEGRYFAFLNDDFKVPIGSIQEPWWATHFLSMDYGFSNSAAACGLYYRSEGSPEWPNGRILKVGELIERQMGSVEFAHHVCQTFAADRQVQGRRPQISACYFDPAMDAHTGTGQSNAEMMAEVFERYDISMIKAAKDRIGNAQKAYHMMKTGEFAITDACPKTWTAFTTRMHDLKMPGAIRKVPGEDLDDLYDETVYGLNTFLDATVKPKEEAFAQRYRELKESGLDDHSLNVYAMKFKQEAQIPEAPARMGGRSRGMIRR